MVKKTSKFEVHSGNTLKASNSKHTKLYCKQSFLVREYDLDDSLTVEHKDLDKELCDWDVGQNNITYSLNKKGRWELPLLLKEHIHSDEISQEYKISLLEHHKLKRHANCVSYHSSKGEITKITPKKGYFDQSSIKNKPIRRKRRRRNRRTEDSDDDENVESVPAEPQIIYRVYYPCSKKSSITHNPKYICKTDSSENGQAKRSANRRAKLTTSSFLDIYDEEVNAEEYFEDGDEIDGESLTDADKDLSSEEMPQTSPLILELLLDRAFKAKDLCDFDKTDVCPKSLARVSKTGKDGSELADTKSCVVYMDEDLPADYYPKAKYPASKQKEVLIPEPSAVPSAEPSAEPSHPKTMPSARILISSEAVTTTNLRKQFENKYFEADCHPRKFGIDLTQEMTEICQKRKLISFIQEPWSWIIFTYDGIYDNGLHVFRVQLNSELGFNQPVLETLFEMNIYTMEEIRQSVAMFVESCSPDSIQKQPTIMRATTSRPVLTFDLLRSLKDWDRETYHSSQSYKTTLMNSAQACFEVEEPVVPIQNSAEFCNICFAAIDTSVLENGPATSLQSCDHWFCNSCWREHFQSTIDRGQLSLQCPEFDCKVQADHMTVLSLIPATEYKKFLQHCHDNKLQSESETVKWCPNPRCGRILKAVNKNSAANGKMMCVTCDCGSSVCFNCLGEAHWPATCQQSKEHKEKMKRLGDDTAFLWINMDTTFVVDVKYCPKCRQPINKNGGCPFMACVCGFEFCWACLSAWPHKKPCINGGKPDSHGTLKRPLYHVDRLRQRPRFYSMSVNHRYHRQPRMLKVFRKNEKALKATLKRWGKQHFSHLEPTLAVYGIKEGNLESLTQAVDNFIGQIANLAVEIHFVIENTAIILQDGIIGRNTALVRHIIERMEFIVSRIEQIFDCNSFQDLRCILPRLTQLQETSRKCLVSLISALADSNGQ